MVCPVCEKKLKDDAPQHVEIKPHAGLKIDMYTCQECKTVFDIITRLKEKGE